MGVAFLHFEVGVGLVFFGVDGYARAVAVVVVEGSVDQVCYCFGGVVYDGCVLMFGLMVG